MAALIVALVSTRSHREPLLLHDVIGRKLQEPGAMRADSGSGGSGLGSSAKKVRILPEIYKLLDEYIDKFPVSSMMGNLYYKAYLLLDQQTKSQEPYWKASSKRIPRPVFYRGPCI